MPQTKGAAKILEADESFNQIVETVVDYNVNYPDRGFSSFKFIPGTNDKYIIALRSSEKLGLAHSSSTYLSIFSVEGHLLTPEEIEVSKDFKFEGIEIY